MLNTKIYVDSDEELCELLAAIPDERTTLALVAIGKNGVEFSVGDYTEEEKEEFGDADRPVGPVFRTAKLTRSNEDSDDWTYSETIPEFAQRVIEKALGCQFVNGNKRKAY